MEEIDFQIQDKRRAMKWKNRKKDLVQTIVAVSKHSNIVWFYPTSSTMYWQVADTSVGLFNMID